MLIIYGHIVHVMSILFVHMTDMYWLYQPGEIIVS